MHYDELEIEIRSTAEDRFAARVTRAPFQDRPEVSFGLPLQRAQVTALLLATGREKTETAPPDPEVVGRTLYAALFQGDLEDLLLRSQARVEAQGLGGLRLRLKFDLKDKQRDYLAALPWELLRNPKLNAAVATDITTPLVRDLVHSNAARSLEVPSPLCILVVDAAPTTLHTLKLDLEYTRLRHVLAKRVRAREVKILRLTKATMESMRAKLRAKTIHVLHFMGHGGYHGPTGFGAVYFETPDGKEDQVSAEDFADHLAGIHSLRLVVLNSCKSGRYGGRLGSGYYGVAARVVERTGMPAVIAHQHSINDDVALKFSEVLYGRIAANDPVDVALTETRLLLKRTPQWTTPVLFMSSRDGKLFADRVEGEPVSRAAAVVPRNGAGQAKPLHLGIVSFRGQEGKSWGDDVRRDADETLDLTECFDPASPDGRYVRDDAQWGDEIFPRLREFLMAFAGGADSLLLDFAAHLTVAFAAGYVLEAKSGLDVRVRQRTQNVVLDWAPDDGRLPDSLQMNDGAPRLWLPSPEIERGGDRPDRALAVSISNPGVAEQASHFIDRRDLPVGRILDATIAPQPGQRAMAGGTHALRAAQDLIPWARLRKPGEERGMLHLFLSVPHSFAFYLGQLSRSLGGLALYEYAMGAKDSYGRYRKSLELPPIQEATEPPADW